MLEDLLRLLLLQDANTRVVLLGTALLGVTSGIIGSFAVLRGRALIGDALAHAALPGLCVAYFVIRGRSFVPFMLGALAFGVLGVLCISFIRSQTRIKEDAAIGLVLSTFFGLGIVLSGIIQNQPTGNQAGLDRFIFGSAAGMVRQDVALMAIVGAVVVGVVLVLFKEFRALCFDREFIGTLGRPVFLLDLTMLAMLCLCTVSGLPAVGVVLMAALLIIPGAAARFWTDRLATMLLIAGGIGLISCVLGTSISALVTRLPAGPTIVLVAGGCFLVSMLFAPRRGVLSELARRWSLRRRYGVQNALRALYELREPARDFLAPVSLEELMTMRAGRGRTLRKSLRRAVARGLVSRENAAYRFTPRGLEEAVRVVRAHRLWEAFLLEEDAVAPQYVHRDADEIEHVLPSDLLAKLEDRLRLQNRLPGVSLPSPHPLRGGAP